jgi:hypothetical protein
LHCTNRKLPGRDAINRFSRNQVQVRNEEINGRRPVLVDEFLGRVLDGSRSLHIGLSGKDKHFERKGIGLDLADEKAEEEGIDEACPG